MMPDKSNSKRFDALLDALKPYGLTALRSAYDPTTYAVGHITRKDRDQPLVFVSHISLHSTKLNDLVVLILCGRLSRAYRLDLVGGWEQSRIAGMVFGRP